MGSLPELVIEHVIRVCENQDRIPSLKSLPMLDIRCKVGNILSRALLTNHDALEIELSFNSFRIWRIPESLSCYLKCIGKV